MERKKSESLAQDKQIKKSVKHIPDSKIDYSDIPELTKEQLKSFKKGIGRPPKKIA